MSDKVVTITILKVIAVIINNNNNNIIEDDGNIPVVIGALGMVTSKVENWIGKLGFTTKTERLQKTALLGTARIIRRVMSM